MALDWSKVAVEKKLGNTDFKEREHQEFLRRNQWFVREIKSRKMAESKKRMLEAKEWIEQVKKRKVT